MTDAATKLERLINACEEDLMSMSDDEVIGEAGLQALHRAVSWWLKEGKHLVEYGAPAWVFEAREVLEAAGMDDFDSCHRS